MIKKIYMAYRHDGFVRLSLQYEQIIILVFEVKLFSFLYPQLILELVSFEFCLDDVLLTV